ncbi:MAG TPA: hypothetical protein VNM69_08675 [Bacillus sp. (in: firmicutes)]|uniref:hypothetical protein n=1 Tax=Bacillus litorisediminis TaxID=2922713 RepID=UPI001FAE10AD|nr:hypothetical protein [Bacillus litorisediminis]HWO75954.1 hypothetical protein [Bacillus sp. (in: firmicutes)]
MNANLLSQLTNHSVIWIRGMEEINNSAVEDTNGIIINYQVNDRSFLPYYTIGQLLKQMGTIYSEKTEKMEEVDFAFEQLMNSWKRMDMSSDSVIYSIIRRISRESSATSKLIDQVAEKIVEMVDEIFLSEGKKLIIVINSSEWIDRPSLRVLHRIFKLLSPSKFKLILGFTGDVPSKFELNDPFNMVESISVARTRIFKRLLAEQKPLIIGDIKNQIDFSDYHFLGTENGLMSDAAIALITQNYENAFLACDRVLISGNIKTEEIFRIIGLVHANLSLYEAAYSAFQEALKYEDHGPKRAHIECLAALLAVKRFYNLDIARAHYEEALKFVDETDAINRLEKGWILNGMSFMETVAASKLEGEEKNNLYDSVLKREMEALALIKNQKDSASLYLKYNLMSNITFLLEIRRDYKSAVEFWKSAFTKLIGDETGYLYRTGMLSWKAGQIEEGVHYLKRSYQNALSQKDRLDSESIVYALGYVNLDIGNYEEAIKYFSEGLKISFILREYTEIEEHIKGYLRASSLEEKLDENIATLKAICANFDGVLPENISEFFKNETPRLREILFKKTLRHPKTKLSSYHPSVDLEAVPEIDMNEYLIRNSKESSVEEMRKILTRS